MDTMCTGYGLKPELIVIRFFVIELIQLFTIIFFSKDKEEDESE